jgi:CheY-like chemotaxis protein
MIFVLRPDLMVLDMSMPGMDGIAVAKIMKVRMPLLPIIMFTNFAEDQFLKKEVLDSGIARLVSKSDAPGLLRAVEDVFRA